VGFGLFLLLHTNVMMMVMMMMSSLSTSV